MAAAISSSILSSVGCRQGGLGKVFRPRNHEFPSRSRQDRHDSHSRNFLPRREGFGVALIATFARRGGETASTGRCRTRSLEAVVEKVERLAQIFPGVDDRRVQIGRNDRRSEPLPMARELADQRLE